MKNKKDLVSKVFNSVFNKYDLMNDILSLGKHRDWKKNLIHWMSPRTNTKLIDVATGTGDVANLYLKNTFFKGEAFCVDNNNKMLNIAKKKFSNLKNIHWLVKLTFFSPQVSYIYCNILFLLLSLIEMEFLLTIQLEHGD